MDHRGLHLQALSTNEVHSVDVEPAIDPWRVWWYPSGDRLLILGKDTTGIQSLWSVSIFGGPLRHLITGVWDAAVSPQGDRIALIPGATPDRKSNREIWTMGPDGSNPEVLAEADEGSGFWRVAWTPDGSLGVKVARELQGTLHGPAAWYFTLAWRFDSPGRRPAAEAEAEAAE